VNVDLLRIYLNDAGVRNRARRGALEVHDGRGWMTVDVSGAVDEATAARAIAARIASRQRHRRRAWQSMQVCIAQTMRAEGVA